MSPAATNGDLETGIIFLAILADDELWCMPSWAEGFRPNLRFKLAAGRWFRAQNKRLNKAVAGLARWSKCNEGGDFMRTAFWLAGAAALLLSGPAFAGDTIK